MIYVGTSSVVVLSVACLIRRVLDLVYAAWRVASWRSECIDARTSSDDWHMGCGTWGVARYTVSCCLIVVGMYGLCEFYVFKGFSRDIVRHNEPGIPIIRGYPNTRGYPGTRFFFARTLPVKRVKDPAGSYLS